MILHDQQALDTLLEARAEAVLRRKTQEEIIEWLDEQISDWFSGVPDPVGFSGAFTYSGKGRQGNNLPRDGKRDNPVRYHRGSKASDEGPLR